MDARERGRHRGLDRGVGRDRAALVRLSGRTRDTGPVAAGVLGLRHADVARREDRRLHHLARPPIERDVDAAERAAERVRLDDRDAGDFVRDGLMGVAGRDHVDEPARQALREREDLRVRIARREIVRRRELRARAARVRGEDHDLRAARAQRRRLGRNRFAEWRDVQTLHVRTQRRAQRIDRHDADDPHLHARGVDERRRVHVRPSDALAGRVVDQVRREKREWRARCERLDRAARIAVG